MWFFELLLRLYPASFRSQYEESLRQSAEEERAERGNWAFLLHLLRDFLLGWPPLLARELGQDCAYAWRSWGRTPVLTGLAILTLALALGVSTGAFAVLHATKWRSLPFADAHRLVMLESWFPPVFDGPEAYRSWAEQMPFLSGVASFTEAQFSLHQEQGALRVTGAETSANFFALLGTRLQLGRGFEAEEGMEGKGRVAVISYGLFEQAFGGDHQILGRAVRIAGKPMTVVGVAPPGFDYPHGVGFWSPTLFDQDYLPKSGVLRSFSFGRLAPGLDLRAANAALKTLAARAKQEVTADPPELILFTEALGGRTAQASGLLLAAVVALLLIACANLAHLFLARFEQRVPELQLRTWLGASAGRLRQQLITECLLLALLAGVLALGVAWGTVRLAAHYLPPDYSFQNYELSGPGVFGFAFAATLGCGLFFGLLPRFSLGPKQSASLRTLLLFGQSLLTTFLLIGAMQVGFNLAVLHRADLGYDTNNVDTATVSLAGTKFDSKTGRSEFLRLALEHVQQEFPQAQVAAVDFLPMSGNSFMAGRYVLDNRKDPLLALHVTATPALFSTLQTRLIAGREFRPEDHSAAAKVAIVNERFAQNAGGLTAVLGRKLIPAEGKEGGPEVVGVVGNFHFAGPPESGIPAVFRPLEQEPKNFFTVVVRRPGSLPSLAGRLREVLAGLEPDVPVYDVMPFADRLERALARPNFYGLAVGFCGGLALLLTLLHLYSLAGHTIVQREREIAIRQALGASPSRIQAFLMKQFQLPVSLGLIAGFALAARSEALLGLLLERPKAVPVLWLVLLSILLLGILMGTVAAQSWRLNLRMKRFNA